MVKNRELILIVDFGAGDSHLIARRVRSAHVFSEIMPYTAPAADMLDKKPKGIILCGAADDANVDAALRSAGRRGGFFVKPAQSTGRSRPSLCAQAKLSLYKAG